MAEPFVGEIKMFAGNFAPRDWAFCDGQLLAVSQNDALFSLLGTMYGGDGRTTFGLPDLRGRIPIHAGSGPGLTPRQIGRKAGSEKVTVTTNQLPSHTHKFKVSGDGGTDVNPNGKVLTGSPNIRVYREAVPNEPMGASSTLPVGGNQSHNNLMPFTCVHFIIALFGVYPSRQ